MHAWLVSRRGVYTLLFVGVGLAFHNTFGNSFHYDDEHSLVENPHIRSLSNVASFFVDSGMFSGLVEAQMYRPLLLVTYALNYAAGGYDIFGYHLINFLLHLANACLVWEMLRRLVDSRAALMGAALFAVHPVMSEPVNYISSRSSLLATAFFLAAFLSLQRGVESGLNRRCQWRIAVFYGAALLSKSIAVVFPVMAVYFLRYKCRRPFWPMLMPCIVVTVAYLLGTRRLVANALGESVRELPVQWATQIKALGYYLWLVVEPVHLSVEPQFSVARNFGDSAVLAAGGFIAVCGWLVWRCRGHVVAFGCVWFVVCILPASLIPLNVLVNEHRLYLPMVGVVTALAATVSATRGWVAVLLIWIVLCVQRNSTWRSETSLWADAVSKGPAMARPHVNLGKAMLAQGRFEAAIASSRKALEVDPTEELAYYNIGTAYLRMDRLELAETHLRRALEIRPELFAALNNLANCYIELERYTEAIETYRRADAVQPQAQVHHNMGAAWLSAGKPDSAAAAFAQALQLNSNALESVKGLVKAYHQQDRLGDALGLLAHVRPRWPQETDLWFLEGQLQAAMGREQEAVRAFARAGVASGEEWLLLGDEARRRRSWQKARGYYERALEEGRGGASLHNAMGEVRYGEGHFGPALEQFRLAARLNPEMGIAYVNIGRVNQRHARFLEAIAAFERALETGVDKVRVQALLADACRGAGQLNRAEDIYRKLLLVAPHVSEFHYNLGHIYDQQNQATLAEKFYLEALDLDPRLVEALFAMGTRRLNQERHDEAAVFLERATELRPNYADAFFNLANAYLHLGSDQRAVVAYERFLSLTINMDEATKVAQQNLAALRRRVFPESNIGR